MSPSISKYHGVYETASEDSRNIITESHVSGTKLCLLFTCLVFLGFLCISNLLILAVMYDVLDIEMDGIQAIPFLRSQHQTRWVLNTDFETILIPDGEIQGFMDQEFNIIGENQNLTLSANFLSKSEVSLTSSGTVMKTNNFKFISEETKKSILDFDENKDLSIIGEFGGKSIITNAFQTPQIISQDEKDLEIIGGGNIYLTGNEGLTMHGKRVNISANGDISFKVENRVNSLSVDGLFQLNGLRIPNSNGETSTVTNATRFRLCVCTKTGALFRVEIPNEPPFPTCAIAVENPC